MHVIIPRLFMSLSFTMCELVLNKKFIKYAVPVVILILMAALPSVLVVAQDSSSVVSSARQQLISCYDAAKTAEAAGANISSLTSVLNEAGSLLSQSELAYSKGDFSTAQSLATQSSQRLGGFISMAGSLRDSAIQQSNYDFWINTVGSSVGALVVVLIGLQIWRVSNKRGTRVEVLNDEPAEL